MKQTAVEWYNEQLNIYGDKAFNKEISLGEYHIKKQELLQQAKEMEKEQSEKMYEYAAWAMFYNGHGETFDEYWNKNFKSE